jgi:CubicO group peptidase (beta-lactamase class C family)
MKRRDFLVDGLAGAGLMLAASGGARPLSAPQSDERFEGLARLVGEQMEAHRIPGVALGVVKDGRTLARGFGVTHVEDPRPITPETVFPIASISKTVAATALLRLVEAGRIELDAPVRRYLPDFRVRDDAASETVTLRHLLTHTPGWEGQLGTAERGDATLAEFTASLAEIPQLAPPGAVWSYNNAAFGLAGRVLEVVVGDSVHDALRDLVFAPLGLVRAVSRAGDALTHRFAAGHRESGGETAVQRPFSFFANVTAGGLAMSLDDLLRYARFHMGDADAGAGSVLSLASIEQMRTAQVRKAPTDDDVGLGWQLRRVGGVLTAAHGGTLGGHILHIQLVPERALAFVILTNHANGWRLIQEVERAALRTYEALVLAPNQRIAHRGFNEDMTAHATPLAEAPDPREYVGTYRRPPVGTVEIREEGGRLTAGSTPLAFYGPDVAYAVSGGAGGRPYEFVRNGRGEVGWVRATGRIAAKDGVAP